MSTNIENTKMLDEILHLRASNSALHEEISFLKDSNEFLRKIIESLISKQ